MNGRKERGVQATEREDRYIPVWIVIFSVFLLLGRGRQSNPSRANNTGYFSQWETGVFSVPQRCIPPSHHCDELTCLSV